MLLPNLLGHVVVFRNRVQRRFISKHGSNILLSPIFMFDPMSELSSPVGNDDPLAPTSNFGSPAPSPAGRSFGGGQARSGGFGGPGGGNSSRYGEEIHSITIRARQRTFYIDLKQSGNGKFFKVSEKSRGGQKSTIVFDVEDLDAMISAFQEMKTKL